jgi:hypothetical protein
MSNIASIICLAYIMFGGEKLQCVINFINFQKVLFFLIFVYMWLCTHVKGLPLVPGRVEWHCAVFLPRACLDSSLLPALTSCVCLHYCRQPFIGTALVLWRCLDATVTLLTHISLSQLQRDSGIRLFLGFSACLPVILELRACSGSSVFFQPSCA